MGGENSLQGQCEICGNQAEFGPDRAIRTRKCPRCGTFEYDSTEGWLKVETADHMVRLSGWVREQNDAGVEFPRISADISRRVARIKLPGLRARARRVLRVVAAECPGLDNWFDIRQFAETLELQGRSYSVDADAAGVLIRLLCDDGSLRYKNGLFGLSIAGLLEMEALEGAQSNSTQGFVAMSFDENLRDAWVNGFDPAIRAAGFTPLRIDGKEYIGGISDEIIAEIRRSSFVVADYTQQKNGVYFEAGYALGLGVTVIPTCRADEVSRLHFDIKHLNTLLWSDPVELAGSLSKRIVAVVGAGPNLLAR